MELQLAIIPIRENYESYAREVSDEIKNNFENIKIILNNSYQLSLLQRCNIYKKKDINMIFVGAKNKISVRFNSLNYSAEMDLDSLIAFIERYMNEYYLDDEEDEEYEEDEED